MSGVDAAVIPASMVLEYSFRVRLVFGQVAYAIGGVTRVAFFTLSWINEGAAAVNHIAQS